MDKRTYLRHRKIAKAHTKHCYKCGRPMREGCLSSSCNEIQHCACDMIQGK